MPDVPTMLAAIDAIENGMACDACGCLTPLALLDGKPHAGRVDWTKGDDLPPDFDRFECPACYGPGYLPGEDRGWREALAIAWRRTLRRNLDVLNLTWRAVRMTVRDNWRELAR